MKNSNVTITTNNNVAPGCRVIPSAKCTLLIFIYLTSNAMGIHFGLAPTVIEDVDVHLKPHRMGKGTEQGFIFFSL
jgi:hypothetical protein